MSLPVIDDAIVLLGGGVTSEVQSFTVAPQSAELRPTEPRPFQLSCLRGKEPGEGQRLLWQLPGAGLMLCLLYWRNCGYHLPLVTWLICLCWNLNLDPRICAFPRFAVLSKMALNLNPSVNKGWYFLLKQNKITNTIKMMLLSSESARQQQIWSISLNSSQNWLLSSVSSLLSVSPLYLPSVQPHLVLMWWPSPVSGDVVPTAQLHAFHAPAKLTNVQFPKQHFIWLCIWLE